MSKVLHEENTSCSVPGEAVGVADVVVGTEEVVGWTSDVDAELKVMMK